MTNLKRIRLSAGITQATLAENSGVSLRTLQEYEQGRKPINQAAAITVYKIAQILRVPVENILEL
jgi:transcriptional regulator with XRE-family HTH domain